MHFPLIVCAGLIVAASLAIGGLGQSRADAATPVAPLLGTASSFAVLAGSTVTNTGPSVIGGDLGVSPGSAVKGFPPGLVISGAMHDADAVALQAQSDLTTAYNQAAGQPSTPTATELGGQTLVSGVYSNATALGLTGTVTLNGQGDPNAVFIFQAGSTLITASASRVALINGASACNVFWQIGSSATLATNSTFVGNLLALTSVTLQTGARVQGRILARNGAVTLDDNVITRATCTTALPSTSAGGTSTSATGTTGSTGSTGTTGTSGGTGTTGPTGTGSPSGGAGSSTTGTAGTGSGTTGGPGQATTATGGGSAPALGSGTTNSGASASAVHARSSEAAAAVSTVAGAGPLAQTGTPLAAPLLAGLLATIIGIALLMASRRKSSHRPR